VPNSKKWQLCRKMALIWANSGTVILQVLCFQQAEFGKRVARWIVQFGSSKFDGIADHRLNIG